MTLLSIDPESNGAWRRTRLPFQDVRDLPTSGDNPYSPLLCSCLLVAAGLILGTGHWIAGTLLG